MGIEAKMGEEPSQLPEEPVEKPPRQWPNISTSPDYGKLGPTQHALLQSMTLPHIQSFDWAMTTGLPLAARSIVPVEFQLKDMTRIKLYLLDASLQKPKRDSSGDLNFSAKARSKAGLVFPCECRSGRKSYSGQLSVKLCFEVGKFKGAIQKKVADVPVMVKSSLCNLHGMSPAQMVANREDAEEIGGYFIINGNEKVIRMLIMQRRNYPIAMQRSTWTKHNDFTSYGVSLRSVAADATIANLTLHYLKSMKVVCAFIYMKQQFFVPLGILLRALVPFTDHEMFTRIVGGDSDNNFFKSIIVKMLIANQVEGLITQEEARTFIGKHFRIALFLPEWISDDQACQMILKMCICVNLDSDLDKFNLLAFMTRKLVALIKGECAAENPDSPMNFEVLTPGELYLQVIKDKLNTWLLTIRMVAMKLAEDSKRSAVPREKLIPEAVSKSGEITSAITNFISTGNITSKNSLGLQQASGMCVMAEKINFMRFMSHFRAVHRGSFFLESRITSVRKLLSESWGFICPVHTPDGAPCGLLNHLPIDCLISTNQPITGDLELLLPKLRCLPAAAKPPWQFYYDIMYNGRLIGYCDRTDASHVVRALRKKKIKGIDGIPKTLEIAFVPYTMQGCQYPGIFLFSGPSRFIRRVFNLKSQCEEILGSFEQVYLNVALRTQKDLSAEYTHQELTNTSFISLLGNTVPYSDCNPSPRNIYQCQMAKQTMGFPSYTLYQRSDSKMYCLQTPQTPISRTKIYEEYNLDEFPWGTNAIVAVIAYSGYDMEDSMILNRASVERGFMNAAVIKTLAVDLVNDKNSRTFLFHCADDDIINKGYLTRDGMPPVGRVLRKGEPLYSCLDTSTNVYSVGKYENAEDGFVISVKAADHDTHPRTWQRAFIQIRIRRNPIIGDKNASRAGQKGICSRLYHPEDLPFTEGGMVPDIMFNPHGFPSRMTIGMMIELMANKVGAVNGEFHDASSFAFNDESPAIEYFGEKLRECGFNYYGLERLYSGVSGMELTADIFFGPIYYQRLRHMVSDKFQVRTTGKVDRLTQQPIKGRQKGGGIRVGEMERDGFLSHGCAFIAFDRLYECSDKSYVAVCKLCGNTFSPNFARCIGSEYDHWHTRRWECIACKTTDSIVQAPCPAVFKLLIAELTACNIKVSLTLTKNKMKKRRSNDQ